jgi:hypothetical protein
MVEDESRPFRATGIKAPQLNESTGGAQAIAAH